MPTKPRSGRGSSSSPAQRSSDRGANDTLNSRGLVELKLGAFDAAIADYDVALARNAKDADSLYARGAAKLKKGDTDIAAAKAITPDIAAISAGYGIAVDAATANATPATAPPVNSGDRQNFN